MQKPISSEKDGFTTWFFSMPFFNDDFMPSVTVGDKWFAASTSKNQALDLVNKAAKGGETRTGLWFERQFQGTPKIPGETIKMLEKNSKAHLRRRWNDTRTTQERRPRSSRHWRTWTNSPSTPAAKAALLRSSVHFKTR